MNTVETAHRARILVIDDNHLNRELLKGNLEEQGYTVALAEDGLRGLDLMRSEPFDLILLDLVMPRMDGYKVLGQMKADRKLRYVPVIVISSESETESIMQCMEMGATDYLPKPFDPDIMRSRVFKALVSAPQMCMLEQSGASLLVVDDDAFNRLVLSTNLEEKGYSVVSVSGGREALDMLSAKSFDAVFLDLVMPDIDGIEVLMRMKADGSLDKIPVIVVTGDKDTERIAQCIELGATDNITKPFDPAILHARLNASLAGRRLRDKELAYNEAIRIERLKAEELLLNIMPKSIADRLRHGEENIADSFDSVTVLFADIAGFTELSATISPQTLVSILNDVFSSFDKLAKRHGVEKIKTIGDSYMAAGGLPMQMPGHAEAVAKMAIDMFGKIEKINEARGLSLRIRIGIHSGPVVAGVIGTRKFTYDLWGDTVNIASRMESHGVPDKIQVSDSTYKLLKDKYSFTHRGSLEIKGKGTMLTYILNRPENPMLQTIFR